MINQKAADRNSVKDEAAKRCYASLTESGTQPKRATKQTENILDPSQTCIKQGNTVKLEYTNLRQILYLSIMGELKPAFSDSKLTQPVINSMIVLDNIELYNVYMEYKTNRNIVYSCKYHVVFCPKYRRSVLINGVDVRLKELIIQSCGQMNVEIIEMEIMPDHVHLLLEVDPQFGIHKAVKQIKGCSSRVLRNEFPWLRSRLPSLWTNSYFVSTVGGAQLAVIKQYIEDQKNV